MRYRIVINPLLDCVLITVTKTVESRGSVSHSTRMFTFDQELADHGGLVEVLSWLTEQVAASSI